MLDIELLNKLLMPYGISVQKSVSLNNTYLISYTNESSIKIDQILTNITELISNISDIDAAKHLLIYQLSELESEILSKKNKYDLLTLVSKVKNNFYFLSKFFDKN